jgi:hypothetical protein
LREEYKSKSPVTVTTTGGKVFLIYSGRDHTIFFERVRKNGRRDSKNILQFTRNAVIEGVMSLLTNDIEESRCLL